MVSRGQSLATRTKTPIEIHIVTNELELFRTPDAGTLSPQRLAFLGKCWLLVTRACGRSAGGTTQRGARTMDEQKMLDGLVREWEAEGRWVDRGRWTRATNGTLEYLPTKREIATKCNLFRGIAGWRGQAAANSPWRPRPASDLPVGHHVAHEAACRGLFLRPDRSSARSHDAHSGHPCAPSRPLAGWRRQPEVTVSWRGGGVRHVKRIPQNERKCDEEDHDEAGGRLHPHEQRSAAR